MGRSTTCKYRIVFKMNVGTMTPFGKNAKMNNIQLEDYRKALNYSFNYGPNKPKEGVIPHVTECKMIDQKTGEVIALVKAPMFEVV